MSVQVNLSGLAGDDLEFTLSLTYQDNPLDLGTISSVTVYLKSTALASDATAKTYGIGTGLTVVSSPQGQLTWQVPNADVPGNNWYKARVTDGQGRLATAVYGRLDIEAV